MIKLQRLIKRMVKERSDSQFVGLLTRGLDDLFADLLNSEMRFLKSHLYQLSNADLPLHCLWIFSLSLYLGSEAVELAECKRQQIRLNHAWTALFCSTYCCLVLCVLFSPFDFSEVETASEMTKIMLEWVFYLLTLVNIAVVNWSEQFMLSVNHQ